MKQTYISSVSSDNLSKENICGWIINPLLMQKWGEAPHFFLADLTSYITIDYNTNIIMEKNHLFLVDTQLLKSGAEGLGQRYKNSSKAQKKHRF